MKEARMQPPSPLQRGSGIPLYHQIQQRIFEQIRSGALNPNEPLPSIQKLAERMRVSPMTVRQAIKSLSELGVLYSRQGKGTFISSIKLEKDFRHVLSFTEETIARGGTPHSQVISFRIQAPGDEAREALALAENEKVFRLRRVRFSDSLPMAIECSCLPERLCPGLLENFDPATSLYHELQTRYGLQVSVTDEVIEVARANAEEARLLQIPARSPIFVFTRTSFLEDGNPVEYVRSVYRGDRYKVVNRLMRAKRELYPALEVI